MSAITYLSVIISGIISEIIPFKQSSTEEAKNMSTVII